MQQLMKMPLGLPLPTLLVRQVVQAVLECQIGIRQDFPESWEVSECVLEAVPHAEAYGGSQNMSSPPDCPCWKHEGRILLAQAFSQLQ